MGIQLSERPLASGRKYVRRGIVIVLAIFLSLIVWTEPTAMLTHVPSWITCAGGCAGFGLGVWLVFSLVRLGTTQKQWFSMLGLPILMIFVGTFLARSLSKWQPLPLIRKESGHFPSESAGR